MRAPLIGHVDADCFYCSAERVRHPALNRVPVGVLGNQGACVIARSYEMKAAQVKVGMPIWNAVKLCPEGVYVKRDFEWYEVLSRIMLQEVQKISDRVEHYSIDEMFFEVPAQENPSTLARYLQQQVLQEWNLPVSVGISKSKTLAKLCSKANKPNGCRVAVTEEEIAQLLNSCSVTKITGIARRSAIKLAKHNITTCQELIAADRRLIRKLLTIKGEGLWWELRGYPTIPLLTKRPFHKFVSRGGSIGKKTNNRVRLEAWVARHVERLVEALRWHHYFTEELALSLVHTKGRSERSVRLDQQTNASEELYPAVRYLFQHVWSPDVTVVQMHLIAGKLTTDQDRQLSLFPPPPPRMDVIKEQVNVKCGRFAVRVGATLPLKELYQDEANSYDICDVYGKSCF
ncbi:Nucleotidyltransferase/DNA polymerase involved in DNA repair [Planctomycetales bacterium 10988]|nr:Nucleotidyltransferase/DNA polymerase involved in DNA repair [Planctomycetales bacterium 10988]